MERRKHRWGRSASAERRGALARHREGPPSGGPSRFTARVKPSTETTVTSSPGTSSSSERACQSSPETAPSLKAAASLVALGAVGTGLAFLWFYTLIAELGPARASIIAYIAPGFSVVYGVTLLNEPSFLR